MSRMPAVTLCLSLSFFVAFFALSFTALAECDSCDQSACCDGQNCFDLNSDDSNCGSCGVSCGTGQSCNNGVCMCVPDCAGSAAATAAEAAAAPAQQARRASQASAPARLWTAVQAPHRALSLRWQP